MGVTVFPTVNDVAATPGKGKTMYEDNLINWLKRLIAQNFVVSGFTVPANSADLNLAVALGEAFVDGRRAVIDASTNVVCTANNTNHVFLNLTKDGSNNVTGAVFTVNTTGTPPADSVKICTVVAGASSITSTTDARIMYPFSWALLPYTPVNKAGDTMTGDLNFFDTNRRFKQSTPGAGLNVESLVYALTLSGKISSDLAGNATLDVTGWNRIDTTKPAVVIRANGTTGIPQIYTAAAGANPIVWSGPYTIWNSGNGGASSGLDADTLDAKHATDFGVNVVLSAGVDLNTIITSGFYRLQGGNTNSPGATTDFGQLIVSRGSDTIFQFVTGYSNNEFYMRHGNPTNIGGIGAWQPWRKLWHDGNDTLLKTVKGTFLDTTTSIASAGTYQMVLPLGVSGKIAGSAVIKGNAIQGVHAIFTTVDTDAGFMTIQPSGSGQVYTSGGGYAMFDSTSTSILLKRAFISGTNLILEFYNVGAAAATLNVRGTFIVN